MISNPKIQIEQEREKEVLYKTLCLGQIHKRQPLQMTSLLSMQLHMIFDESCFQYFNSFDMK